MPCFEGGPSAYTIAKVGATIVATAYGGPLGAAAVTAGFSSIEVAQGKMSWQQALIQTGVSFVAAYTGGAIGGETYGSYVTQGINSASSGITYGKDGEVGWDWNQFSQGMRRGALTMGMNKFLGTYNTGYTHLNTGLSTFVGNSVQFGNRLNEISWDYENWDDHLVAGAAAGIASFIAQRQTSKMQFDNSYEDTFTSAHYFNKVVNNLVENTINATYSIARHGTSFEGAMAQTNFWNSLTYNHQDVGGWLATYLMTPSLEEQEKSAKEPPKAPGPPMDGENILGGIYLSRNREEGYEETGFGEGDELHKFNSGNFYDNYNFAITGEHIEEEAIANAQDLQKELKKNPDVQEIFAKYGVKSLGGLSGKDITQEEYIILQDAAVNTLGSSDKAINRYFRSQAVNDGWQYDTVEWDRKNNVIRDKASGSVVAGVWEQGRTVSINGDVDRDWTGYNDRNYTRVANGYNSDPLHDYDEMNMIRQQNPLIQGMNEIAITLEGAKQLQSKVNEFFLKNNQSLDLYNNTAPISMIHDDNYAELGPNTTWDGTRAITDAEYYAYVKKDAQQNLSTVLDFMPYIGQAKFISEMTLQKDYVTDREISDAERNRTLGIYAAICSIPILGKIAKSLRGKSDDAARLSEKLASHGDELARYGDEIENVIARTVKENGGRIYKGMLVKDAKLVEQTAKGAMDVFRVEGIPNTRIALSETGDVIIKGENTLFLNFGDKARATEFLNKRLMQGMEGVQLKSFQVEKSFFDDLVKNAVPERMAKRFPGRPIIVDVTKANNQFGLRGEWIKKLRDSIIKNSGN